MKQSKKNYIEKTADLIEYFMKFGVTERNIREKKDLIKDIADSAKQTPMYLSLKNSVVTYVAVITKKYNNPGDAATNAVVNFLRVVNNLESPDSLVRFIVYHLPAIDVFADELAPVISKLKKI